MKQTVQMDRIQEKMQPGVYTRDGFLGADRRKLIDILIEDDEAVKRMDLSHQRIAERLIELRDAGMRGLGEFINVEPHYEVRVVSVRGKLPCPFGDPGIFPKTNTVVRNTKLDREVSRRTASRVQRDGQRGSLTVRAGVIHRGEAFARLLGLAFADADPGPAEEADSLDQVGSRIQFPQ